MNITAYKIHVSRVNITWFVKSESSFGMRKLICIYFFLIYFRSEHPDYKILHSVILISLLEALDHFDCADVYFNWNEISSERNIEPFQIYFLSV